MRGIGRREKKTDECTVAGISVSKVSGWNVQMLLYVETLSDYEAWEYQKENGDTVGIMINHITRHL